MGLFDSVFADCPHCGSKVEFQSKEAADPYMNTYSPDDAPDEIKWDILNSPERCLKCHGWMALVDHKYPPGWRRDAPTLTPTKVKPPGHFYESGRNAWWEGPFTVEDIVSEFSPLPTPAP